MQGMTIKQFERARFYRLLEAYREVKTRLNTPQAKQEFILLSVQLHQASAFVSKRTRALINK